MLSVEKVVHGICVLEAVWSMDDQIVLGVAVADEHVAAISFIFDQGKSTGAYSQLGRVEALPCHPQ